MKDKFTLFSILLILFSLFIWILFGDFIKLLFNNIDLKSISYKHEKDFVNKWIIDKEKTEAYLKRNYPNGLDSVSLEEMLKFRNLFMDTALLNIYENGNYEQTIKGFSTLETLGEWHNEDNYLVLDEKSKRNHLKPDLTNTPENLITFYFKVIKIDPGNLILLLDTDKTKNIPNELKLQNQDTVNYKALNYSENL